MINTSIKKSGSTKDIKHAHHITRIFDEVKLRIKQRDKK